MDFMVVCIILFYKERLVYSNISNLFSLLMCKDI